MFGIALSPLIRWVIGILFVISVVFAIYYKGRLDEREIFNRYKAEVKAAALAQEAKVREIEERNRRLNEETKNAYNTKLAKLRSYYGLRLTKGGGTVPNVPTTAGGADGYSIDNLPASIVLASQCAETTLNLLALQDWVKGVYNNQ